MGALTGWAMMAVRQDPVKRTNAEAPGEGQSIIIVGMQVSLSKTFRFEAAHWLPTFPEGHKCRRMHGHSFYVDVVVKGEVDSTTGYLVDYGQIAEVIEPIRTALDHQLLNEIEGLENPTAEQISHWIWHRLKPGCSLLDTIRVHETCTTACEYRGD